MGFAFSLKNVPEEKRTPKGFPAWATVILVLLGIALLAVGIYFLRKYMIARREKNMLFKPSSTLDSKGLIEN